MKSESVGRTGIRFVISCMHRRLDDAGHKSPAQPTTRARQTGRNLLSSSRHAIRYACFCAIRPENARMLACEAFEGQRTSSGFAARCSLRVDRIQRKREHPGRIPRESEMLIQKLTRKQILLLNRQSLKQMPRRQSQSQNLCQLHRKQPQIRNRERKIPVRERKRTPGQKLLRQMRA